MRLLLLVSLLPAACLNPNTDLSTTDAASSTTSSETTTAPSDTSTAESSSTTDTPPPCDDDPACGPGETVQTCPAQCGTCGDGQRTGDELCDNGDDNQTYWPNTPPDGACSETCTFQFEWCGDAKQNGNEPCDNGTNADPVYSPTTPPDGACAPSCTTVAYCGDAVKNGNEPCDSAAQSATCELNCTTPQCGDGITNTAAGEACDDNNQDDGDGCSGDCKSPERLVFVSSLQFYGNLNNEDPEQSANPDGLSGLDLADYRCQTLATKAALSGTYKAWLSTDTESPSTRFDDTFSGVYRLTTTGFPIIAEGWTGLTSGTLANPINATETGKLTENNVFTNTLPNGTSAPGLDCTHWTLKDNTKTTFGSSAEANTMWTNLDTTQCSNPLRLYCFQDI